jgi:nitroreductase
VTQLDDGIVSAILDVARRAPSAHNAQPWRLSELGDRVYLLWYAYADKLEADPDDRDGIMAVGGFYETLRLAAESRGIAALFEPDVRHHAAGISLGTISLAPLDVDPDPLAAAVERRTCNRHPYGHAPLPAGLAGDLESLGNVLLPPDRVAGLVSRASVLSWRDRRFVDDIGKWTRFGDAPDGMTFDCLRLNRFDVLALRLALALGRLPGWLAWMYAQRDVRFTRASGAMAVLLGEGRDPMGLFRAGVRLVRSWTTINAAGFAWHPMSVVIDQATVDDLRVMIDGRDPIAIYRVGFTDQAAARSRRRPIERVLVPAPG